MGNTITAEMAREVTGDLWMNRTQAAKYLGISAQTLANNRAAGPRYAKMFGAVRYRLNDLKTWAAQRVVVR